MKGIIYFFIAWLMPTLLLAGQQPSMIVIHPSSLICRSVDSIKTGDTSINLQRYLITMGICDITPFPLKGYLIYVEANSAFVEIIGIIEEDGYVEMLPFPITRWIAKRSYSNW